MYALQPLTPDAAGDFAPLALASLRPALARLAALPDVAAIGATLLGAPVGLALAVTPPAVAEARRTTRVLSLFVAPAYRRAGIGAALVRRLAADARARGAGALEALVPGDAVGADALEGLLASLGWDGPAMVALRCVSDHRRILAAPWLREHRELPAGYDVLPWVDLADEARDAIRGTPEATRWYPRDLDPFHHERGLDVATSLALRRRGEVVGWMLTHRVAPTVMSYSCGHVRDDLARRGRFLPLLHAAIVRDVATAPDAEHVGVWSTPAAHRAMIRFERTRMAPYSLSLVETRRWATALPDDGVAEERPGAALAASRHARHADPEACAGAAALVREACADWPRVPGPLDLRRADERSARVVAAAVLPGLTPALARALGAPVRAADELPPPAVVVAAADRVSRLPVAPLDAPAARLRFSWDEHDPARAPLAVTLPLAVPTGGAAWTRWALADGETVGLADTEVHALLDARGRADCALARAVLAAHDARGYRQLAPLRGSLPGEQLILVEAVARWVDDGWVLHG